ncbi:unnamed protein product, partial [Lampetra fluviatilis]
RLHQEKHSLRQRLERCSSEWECRVSELEGDLQAASSELQSARAALRSADRERSASLAQLSEQNQRLLEQLTRAAEVEQQLSTQVVGLRDEFREKSFSTQQHLARLESLQAEIRLLTERKSELERRLRDAALENEQLHAAVHEMQQRDFALQHAGRARDAQLRECELELQEACSGRRQLQLRLDSLQQELSLVSGEPHGASPESLLAELTRSEHSQRLQQRSREVEVEVWDVYCQLHSLCTQLRVQQQQLQLGSPSSPAGSPGLTRRGSAEPTGSLNELRGPLRLDDRTSSESAGLPSLEEGERAEPEGLPRLDDVGGVAPGGLRVMVKELKQLVMAVVLTSSNELRRCRQQRCALEQRVSRLTLSLSATRETLETQTETLRHGDTETRALRGE